jgi:hypothetical protein
MKGTLIAMPNDPTFPEIHCNKCGRKQRHEIKASYQTQGSEEFEGGRYSINWVDQYQTLECRGCAEIAFRHRTYFSEWEDPSDDDSGWVEVCFPSRYSRPMPDWIGEVDDILQTVIKETYEALYSDHRFLAAFGARTAIDIVMNSLVGDVGSFASKVNAMKVNGHITETEKDLLVAIIDTGSAAAHRGFRPSEDTLQCVMLILETIITKTIIIPKSIVKLKADANKIKSIVPARFPHVPIHAPAPSPPLIPPSP